MPSLLIINPGSTSTKFGVYQGGKALFTESIRHGAELEKLPDLASQRPVRESMICQSLAEKGIDIASMDAIVGRGGMLHPLEGGVYEVNPDMIHDLESGRYGQHASNLGGIIAAAIGKSYGLPAYIADPVIVDEMEDLARYSGWPGIERRSVFHALNQKAVARRYAAEIDRPYPSLKLIVAHLGGGISVGAHKQGQVVDVNNALSGDGPFSAERTGGLPLFSLMELCYAGQYSLADLKKMFVGKGGLMAYLGTSDAIEIDKKIQEGDQKASQVMEAMAYQIAKEIGAAATVLEGQVDAILITGGLAHDPFLIDWIRPRIEFIAPVILYPGEDELSALADTVGQALAGRLPIHRYQKEAD